MSKVEASGIIKEKVDAFRPKPYAELRELVDGQPLFEDVSGPSGTKYRIEIVAFWDDRSNGNIRLQGFIDELPKKPIFWKIPVMKWIPIYVNTDGHEFIKSPSDEFIGE
jgi:hypothetical protein